MQMTGTSVCVVLVSPYLVQEFPSPNGMRNYLFETRKSQACSKSIETASHLSAMVSFLLMRNKTGIISSLAQHQIYQSNISNNMFQVNIEKTDTEFMPCQLLLLEGFIGGPCI